MARKSKTRKNEYTGDCDKHGKNVQMIILRDKEGNTYRKCRLCAEGK